MPKDPKKVRQGRVERLADRYRGMSRAKMLADAQKVFNKLIRLMDLDDEGMLTCCTCGKRLPYGTSKQAGLETMDASHFKPATRALTRFERTNVHPGCNSCNRQKSGNLDAYQEFIIYRYGRGELARLNCLGAVAGFQWPIGVIAEMVTDWREAIRNLEKTKLGEF